MNLTRRKWRSSMECYRKPRFLWNGPSYSTVHICTYIEYSKRQPTHIQSVIATFIITFFDIRLTRRRSGSSKTNKRKHNSLWSQLFWDEHAMKGTLIFYTSEGIFIINRHIKWYQQLYPPKVTVFNWLVE